MKNSIFCHHAKKLSVGEDLNSFVKHFILRKNLAKIESYVDRSNRYSNSFSHGIRIINNMTCISVQYQRNTFVCNEWFGSLSVPSSIINARPEFQNEFILVRTNFVKKSTKSIINGIKMHEN